MYQAYWSKTQCLETSDHLNISDHLPQLFILPDFFSNSPSTKYKIMFHDWENFNNQSFVISWGF